MPALLWTLCFIRRGGQLLLLERRREPNRGLWSGVGGKLDPGESPRDGVLREVREETGLDAADLVDVRFGGVVTWAIEGRPLLGAYAFVVSLRDGVAYSVPRETDEGVLDWKDVEWVLDASNEGVPVSARRYLRALLEGAVPQEHQFRFEGDRLTDYAVVPLSEAQDGDLDRADAVGE